MGLNVKNPGFPMDGDGLNRHDGVRLIQGESSEQHTAEEEECKGKRHKTE